MIDWAGVVVAFGVALISLGVQALGGVAAWWGFLVGLIVMAAAHQLSQSLRDRTPNR